ncbi:MAG: hypothetical protein OK404_01245 [Thaumarchaeota archaeon]|nr:hypothetical protein [Nitrososphaerota archaeon]
MRFLDVAIAGMIGLSSIAVIVTWSPAMSDFASQRFVAQARLRDGIVNILDREGLVWLQQSSLQGICGKLSAISNSTVTFSASIDSVPCSVPPSKSGVQASLTFTLGAKVVVLEAWFTGEA